MLSVCCINLLLDYIGRSYCQQNNITICCNILLESTNCQHFVPLHDICIFIYTRKHSNNIYKPGLYVWRHTVQLDNRNMKCVLFLVALSPPLEMWRLRNCSVPSSLTKTVSWLMLYLGKLQTVVCTVWEIHAVIHAN